MVSTLNHKFKSSFDMLSEVKLYEIKRSKGGKKREKLLLLLYVIKTLLCHFFCLKTWSIAASIFLFLSHLQI